MNKFTLSLMLSITFLGAAQAAKPDPNNNESSLKNIFDDIYKNYEEVPKVSSEDENAPNHIKVISDQLKTIENVADPLTQLFA